jgi:hypothetical protein
LCLLWGFYIPSGLRMSDIRTIETAQLTNYQYPLYAASALAANSFARSSFAAAFPVCPGLALQHNEHANITQALRSADVQQ